VPHYITGWSFFLNWLEFSFTTNGLELVRFHSPPENGAMLPSLFHPSHSWVRIIRWPSRHASGENRENAAAGQWPTGGHRVFISLQVTQPSSTGAASISTSYMIYTHILLLSNLNETNIKFSRALGSAGRVVKFNNIGTVQAQNINVHFTKNLFGPQHKHTSHVGMHFNLFIGFAFA
jgi:hypothetical protein